MSQDWLLIETLGEWPAVVAHGRQMKNFVPISVFFRRSPNLPAIQAAIAQTVSSAAGFTTLIPGAGRLISTEPVVMLDGRVHGSHLWCGPVDEQPPQRPIPGAWKSDRDLKCSATQQFLANIGKDPAVEPLTGRSIADDIPAGSFNEGESMALSWAVDMGPGRTFAANWGFTDRLGMHRRVGFCIRIHFETAEDGQQHLVGRSMNLLEAVTEAPLSTGELAQRIIAGMGRPGVYRAIIDLNTWRLIKWLDEPCPFYDWRAQPQVHPDDQARFAAQMREELTYDQTSGVLRLPAIGGGWTPLHVTVNRIELEKGVFAGLLSLRRPTQDEAAAFTAGSGRP